MLNAKCKHILAFKPKILTPSEFVKPKYYKKKIGIVLQKGYQIAHGPQPDLETRQPTGLMGGPARCYWGPWVAH